MGTNPPALSGAAPPSPRYPYPHRAGPPSAPPPVSTSSAAFVYQSPPQHSLSGHPQAGLGSMKHPLAAAAPDHYPGSASYLLPPNTGHPYGLSYNQNYGPAYVPQPGGTTSPWLRLLWLSTGTLLLWREFQQLIGSHPASRLQLNPLGLCMYFA
ncbi:hypothetical protein B0H13DRAFT_2341128 [Mycena leptocephala]|nr:hypothetical protein B0H13DRAFT_2341128 [Mycena leptocephala]